MNTLGWSRLACAALFALAAAAGAQPTNDPRQGLAREIVQLPYGREARSQMEQALADVLARPVFRKLRDDAEWGPDSARWQKTFPAFRDGFLRLGIRLAPALENEIAAALAGNMSEGELREVLDLQRDPKLAEADVVLRELGLDTSTLVRVAGMSRHPEYYSAEEKRDVQARLAALSARRGELAQARGRLEPALQALQKPQLLKYQAVLSAVISEALKRLESGGTARTEAEAFFAEWRTRLKED